MVYLNAAAQKSFIKKCIYSVGSMLGLGTVCTGVVMENNAVIVAGEASASKLSRQDNKNVEIYRFVSSTIFINLF